MADNPRLEELQRRIQKDPASIAFAQLAEEHRRIGEFDEAVRIARAGLEQHPAYLSARVTLGRALMELGRFDDAHAEFEQVLREAPDNLVALRSMAELHQRRETAPVDYVPPIRDVATPAPHATQPGYPGSSGHSGHPHTSGQVRELEGWLAAILADRARA